MKQERGNPDPYLKTGQIIRIAGPPAHAVAVYRLRRAGVLKSLNLTDRPRPHGNREDALWTVRDALKLAVWARARRSGIGGRILMRMLREMDRRYGEGMGLEMLLSGDAVLTADSDGRNARILVRQSADRIVELLSRQIVLPLFELKTVHQAILKMPPAEHRAARIHRALRKKAAGETEGGNRTSMAGRKP